MMHMSGYEIQNKYVASGVSMNPGVREDMDSDDMKQNRNNIGHS
jgi:hypothetical protein